jgi:hypothetical protein
MAHVGPHQVDVQSPQNPRNQKFKMLKCRKRIIFFALNWTGIIWSCLKPARKSTLDGTLQALRCTLGEYPSISAIGYSGPAA